MKHKTLKVFEAFAGYGSQRMALRNLGIEHEVVAISEFDKFADASYQAIHGKTWNMGDITKIDVDDVPNHDLFTYSFPCQDISVAGKGKGFDKDSGTRSSLLWECQRVIDAKKPKYLLMENVKNLVSKKFMPDFQKWIDYLESIGYTSYWEVLNAKDFGIPQNRERVFMVSILGEHEPYVFPKPIKLEKCLKDVLEKEVDEKYYLSKEIQDRLTIKLNMNNEIKTIGSTKGKDNTRIGQRDVVYSSKGIMGALTASDYKQPKQIGEPKIKQVGNTTLNPKRENPQTGRTYDADGLAPTLNTMQGGNLQPQIVEPSFVVGSTQKNASITDGSYSPTLTSSMGMGGGNVPMIGEPKIAASRGRNPENPSDRTKGAPTEQRLEVNNKGTSNTLTTVAKDNYVVEPLGTLASGASKQFGVGYMAGLSKTLKANNHDISVLEAISIKNNTKQGYLIAQEGDGMDLAYPTSKSRRDRVQEGISQTLTTDNSKGVVVQYRIRKLTPLEYWRLMGVTDKDFYKAQAVNSNSQLYKQAGNSIVVAVLESIFRNMFLEVPEEDLIGEQIPLF